MVRGVSDEEGPVHLASTLTQLRCERSAAAGRDRIMLESAPLFLILSEPINERSLKREVPAIALPHPNALGLIEL